MTSSAMHRVTRLRTVCLVLSVLLLWYSVGARAQSDGVSESAVKAAFLYKFGSYVEWPDGTFPREDSPITIGVLGADALLRDLRQIADGRTVNGRPVEIREVVDLDDVDGTEVLFIGNPPQRALSDLVGASKQHALLIVTEAEGEMPDGSMINFVVAGNRVSFDVAIQVAQENELRISARLLSVARRVVES